MAYSLGLLIFWLLLFAPLGLAVHWLVLGTSARIHAAPLIPVTGIAVAIIGFSAAREAGIAVNSDAVAAIVVASAVLIAIAQWRRGTSFGWRQLGVPVLVLVLSVVTLASMMFTPIGEGPLGYRLSESAVMSVATIEAAADSAVSQPPIVKEAGRTSGERYTGFEQFAGFTVAAGSGNGIPMKQVSLEAQTLWSGYALYSLITAILAGMVVLPIYLLARWRSIRFVGITALMLVGILTPLLAVNAAYGNGALVAGTTFAVTAIAALLLARRDRGWYAVSAITGGAAFVMMGPVMLLPIACVGIAWSIVTRRVHEHLSHEDVPTETTRPLVTGVVAIMLALYGAASPLLHGAPTPGGGITHSLPDALSAWPWVWMSPWLTAYGFGFSSLRNFLPWIIGPALIALALWRARRARDRRDLALTIGILASVAVCTVIAIISPVAARRAIEASWLIGAPLLALVIVHAVGALRSETADSMSERGLRATPLLAVSLFALISVAAATTTVTRFVHAPAQSSVPTQDGNVLLAAGDSWLDLLLRGTRTNGTNVDADAMAPQPNSYTGDSIIEKPPHTLALTNSPVASDPSVMFAPSELMLPDYPLRFFTRQAQVPTDGTLAEAKAAYSALNHPLRHDAVERKLNPHGGRAAGILLPESDFPTCSFDSLKCRIPKPDQLGNCSTRDLPFMHTLAGDPATDVRVGAAAAADTTTTASRSNDSAATTLTATKLRALPGAGAAANEVNRAVREAQTGATDSSTTGTSAATSTNRPPLTGIACFDVPIEDDAKMLRVHLRDVGLIFPVESASVDSPRSKGYTRTPSRRRSPMLGGGRLTSRVLNTEVTYGDGYLASTYDLTLEGHLGAGVGANIDGGGGTTKVTLDNTTAGFSRTLPGSAVFGNVHIVNTTGTQMTLGRLFARPTADLDRSCDLILRPVAGSATALIQTRTDTTAGTITDPALAAMITSTPERNGIRYAHIVVSSHLLSGGVRLAPRHMLVDWAEQYSASATQTQCGSLTPETIVTKAAISRGLGVASAVDVVVN